MEEQYLAFIDIIGYQNGFYIYRFDFTISPDVVWGENWNVTPAANEPHLFPDPNTISLTGKVFSEIEFNIAKKNTCFSMQDCIDGILPLLFSNPRDNKELILPFGMEYTEVIERLDNIGLEIVELKDTHEEKDNETIENLINNLEGINNGESDNEEDF